MSQLRIDLGCGSCKKARTIGIDIQPQAGVDYVIDLETGALPFPDRSVEYIYSSHFLEHIAEHSKLLAEIGRVCVDGANLEFWTPYGWSNSAFIFTHKTFFNEDHYLHMGVWFSKHWEQILNSRWLIKEFTYVIEPDILVELYEQNISLDFALKYYKGVVQEFGTFIEVRHGYKGKSHQPIRTFTTERLAKRHPIKQTARKNVFSADLRKAIQCFSS
jgi:ubiquinone/menaquinone biosynthesis C-methylase UbiE